MDNKEELITGAGVRTSTTWDCDGIRLGHSISKFRDLTSFPASSSRDVVRLHFGMRGDYMFTYKQLDKTFDLVGGHHNIMYSKDFDMVVQNKTLELETFGVQFPREMFIGFTQNANDLLKRFSEKIMLEQNAILSDNWGSIDSSIQQVIAQIINCPYGGDLKKLFLLS
ncbi:MAG TPA: hypothetical protein VMI35_01245, partial [Puia sp.]|nr:hypothetical protein [Puia sp.]